LVLDRLSQLGQVKKKRESWLHANTLVNNCDNIIYTDELCYGAGELSEVMTKAAESGRAQTEKIRILDKEQVNERLLLQGVSYLIGWTI
jgi:hypothetical protein